MGQLGGLCDDLDLQLEAAMEGVRAQAECRRQMALRLLGGVLRGYGSWACRVALCSWISGVKRFRLAETRRERYRQVLSLKQKRRKALQDPAVSQQLDERIGLAVQAERDEKDSLGFSSLTKIASSLGSLNISSPFDSPAPEPSPAPVPAVSEQSRLVLQKRRDRLAAATAQDAERRARGGMEARGCSPEQIDPICTVLFSEHTEEDVKAAWAVFAGRRESIKPLEFKQTLKVLMREVRTEAEIDQLCEGLGSAEGGRICLDDFGQLIGSLHQECAGSPEEQQQQQQVQPPEPEPEPEPESKGLFGIKFGW
eukprot:TRINITY_DN54377_c0_g1_i1.p1 TRINITY_DN54377_c0_g1~~TRINITY_DN54377_c0_g1_i1.p1  ORF type:complete len:311 (+),score=68.54 TRINITY_DN54377_c0_g1_i1:185-1117(+)